MGSGLQHLKEFSDIHLSHPRALLSPSIRVTFGSGEFMIAAFKILFAKFSDVKIIQELIISESSESAMFSIIIAHRNLVLNTFSFIPLLFLYVYAGKEIAITVVNCA